MGEESVGNTRKSRLDFISDSQSWIQHREKRTDELDGIGVARIRTFLSIQRKQDCQSWKQKNKPISPESSTVIHGLFLRLGF